MCIRDRLCSPNFKPTNGIIYKVVILKGRLFDPKDLAMVNIEAEAKKRNLLKPNAEVACLIHEMLTYKDFEDMGLWHIITMHEPIKNIPVSYTHLRAHETVLDLVCRLLLEKKKI